jgi:hypothetical protein
VGDQAIAIAPPGVYDHAVAYWTVEHGNTGEIIHLFYVGAD